MAKRIHKGQWVTKVANSCHLNYRVEMLAKCMKEPCVWVFTHVKGDGNKVVDYLENVGENVRT